jgi:type II secretory pathway component PulF
MTIYQYTAEDKLGSPTAGQIEASDLAEVRRRLEQRGLRVLEVTEASPESPPGPIEISTKEAEQLARHVAELSAARFPLAPGLRAAADECENPRQACALSWLAGEIEQGRSLEEVLTSSPGVLPRHVSGLVLAAVRTGQLGPALSELAEHQHATASLRGAIFSATAYPLLVACLAAAIFLFILIYIAGTWQRLFQDFGMELPLTTQLLFWWRNVGLWWMAGLLVGLALIAAVLRRRLGRARWHRLLATLPMVGPLWHWSGLAEWCSLLVVLVRHQIPLPEALRLAAEGISNAHVGQLSLALAEGVCRGRSLSQGIASLHQLPASLVPLVRCGEKTGNLAESLATGREMLEDRVRARSFWLQMILPPILFVAIGCMVFLIIGALFMPVFSLVQVLS